MILVNSEPNPKSVAPKLQKLSHRKVSINYVGRNFITCCCRPPIIEILRWDNFCNFGATLLGFGTMFTNIIVHGIRNFGKNRITLTP